MPVHHDTKIFFLKNVRFLLIDTEWPTGKFRSSRKKIADICSEINSVYRQALQLKCFYAAVSLDKAVGNQLYIVLKITDYVEPTQDRDIM